MANQGTQATERPTVSASERWGELLSPVRPYTPSRSTKASTDERSEFERDYDRLIFASPFRRLQDKAQVFPLEHNDFVRTRLTHSLEVSTLGRSIGRQVANRLRREKDIGVNSDDIGSIVATTCLAHDIGNPPFGHFGEEAIRLWFKHNPGVLDGLTEAQQQDFLSFDGNAQGLRILTFLHSLGYNNGLNLTCTTLASFMKYVGPSDRLTKKRKSLSKVGYFQSEAAKVRLIREMLRLDETRHPLVWLMEAADDIAYSIADIEDGFKKKVLQPDTFIGHMETMLRDTSFEPLLEKFKHNLTSKSMQSASERVQAAIQWFRIEAIGAMHQAVVETFLQHHDAILAGSFEQELIGVSSAAPLHQALKHIGVKEVYCTNAILELEVFGERVIRELLSRFIQATTSPKRHDLRTLDGKLYSMISSSLRALQEQYTPLSESRYHQIQLAVDHVSGMTDTYAVMMYQKICGSGSL